MSVFVSDLFAYHSIHLLNLAKVDEVWIGSESNNPYVFEEAYNEFKKEENQNRIKKLMNEGYSYKQATNQIYPLPSNDLLGYSYYKALKEINPTIPLKTIKRVGSTYFDNTPKDFLITNTIIKHKYTIVNSEIEIYYEYFVGLMNILSFMQIFMQIYACV
jgi:predicted nucleotidyltransferase